MNRGHNGTHLPITTMIDKEGKKERQTRVAMAHIFLQQRQHRGRERKRSQGGNGTHLPIAMMTYKEGKKERPQKDEKETEIEKLQWPSLQHSSLTFGEKRGDWPMWPHKDR